jgi:hypothetical protein
LTIDTNVQAFTVTRIPSPHLLFAELNAQSAIKSRTNRSDLSRKGWQGSVSSNVHRYHSMLQTLTSARSSSDTVQPSQKSSTTSFYVPSHFNCRSPSLHVGLADQSSFKLNDRVKSSTIDNQKTSYSTLAQRNQSFPIPKCTPALFEHDKIHHRTLKSLVRSKSQLAKHSQARHSKVERVSSNTRLGSLQDLHISLDHVRNKVKQEMTDGTCKFSKQRLKSSRKRIMIVFNVRVVVVIVVIIVLKRATILTETDDCILLGKSSFLNSNNLLDTDDDGADDDSTMETYPFPHGDYLSQTLQPTLSDSLKVNEQYVSMKKTSTRRRPYNLALPTLVEHIHDDDDDDDDDDDEHAEFV